MKRLLKILGVVLMVASISLWAAFGANRGWTKTSVPITTVDEVTGIEAISYQKRFLPGVELLGAGILAGGLLLSISLLIRKNQEKESKV